jgi:hypothetical protein
MADAKYGPGSPSRNEVTHETRTTARTHLRSDGLTEKHYSIIEERNEYPASPLHQEMIEPVQPNSSRGATDDYEPGGNHYQMWDNGNGNSGPEAVARYPRMEHEIGGCDETTGNDRIQLEHDDPLIHRR